MGFRMLVQSDDPDFGERVRRKLKGWLGNPIMPSKEKEQIKRLEEDEEPVDRDDKDEKDGGGEEKKTSKREYRGGFRRMA